MGRHADPDPRHFWVSLVAAGSKAALGLAVVVVAFLLVSRIGQPTGPGPVVVDMGSESAQPSAGASPGAAPGATATSAETLDPLSPAVESTPHQSASDGPTSDRSTPEERTGTSHQVEGISVQLLDGVGDEELLDAVATVLEGMGYDIVAVSRSARSYEETTVFYSEGFASTARALRRADDRFGTVEPNTRLSASVNLHVVVGADWAR